MPYVHSSDLHFSYDSFETLQVFLLWHEDMHVLLDFNLTVFDAVTEIFDLELLFFKDHIRDSSCIFHQIL